MFVYQANSVSAPIVHTVACDHHSHHVPSFCCQQCTNTLHHTLSRAGTNSRPSTPSTPKYGAKTPGEIVASALRNRTRPPSGVLRKAIGMYQENRRQSQRIRKSSQEARPRSCFIEELEETEEKEKLEVEGRQERVSASAGEWSGTYSILNDPHNMQSCMPTILNPTIIVKFAAWRPLPHLLVCLTTITIPHM